MENKKHVAVAGSSSPLDHLLLPKDPSSPSSTSAILGSIFPPPPKMMVAVARQLTKTRAHPFTIAKRWSLAISAPPSTMIKKDDDPNGTILVELQEGIGGRAHCTTSILLQITNANAARGV
ncbi:hypothetical protein V6N12_042573 [Hibiscus sabdariffa]|uniref:Uncharacterized protein n=1 Tax=Hibiscus sabdariffa TaxID=183260 RepID=A0ABR2EF69_9ROSI